MVFHILLYVYAREPAVILPFRWNQAQQQGSRELVRPGMRVVEAEQERNGEEFIWCHHVFMLLNNRFFTNCLQLLFSLFFFQIASDPVWKSNWHFYEPLKTLMDELSCT